MERNDYQFLLKVMKFCNKIDQYAPLLDLDAVEVDDLKNESRLLAHVLNHSRGYSSCLESFEICKIQNLQTNLTHLAWCCKNSPNYTIEIGKELGIELSVYAFLSN